MQTKKTAAHLYLWEFKLFFALSLIQSNVKKLDLLQAAVTIFVTFWTKQEMNTTHVTQLHFNSRLFIFSRSNDPISKGQLLLMQIIHFILFQ